MILRQTKYGYNAHHSIMMALDVSHLIDKAEEGVVLCSLVETGTNYYLLGHINYDPSNLPNGELD